ncbi:MAG: class I tRNA ligase family protein, partial [Bryobacteraceae bacterium]
SQARRSAQTALYRINYALVRLLAPLLTFTTEEVWSHMKRPAGAPESVHLALLPEPEDVSAGLSNEQRARLGNWDRLMEVRSRVLKSLENARQEKFIGTALEAKVRLSANGDLYPLLAEYSAELPAIFIVSQVEVENAPADSGFAVKVDRAEGAKCERCWKYTTDVGSRAGYPTICVPCADAVKEMLG